MALTCKDGVSRLNDSHLHLDPSCGFVYVAVFKSCEQCVIVKLSLVEVA